MTKKILGIDIETYSDRDLSESGVDKYARSKEFKILLFAYAYDDEEVQIIDLKKDEKIPQSIIDDLTDKEILKTAFNAYFEITCLSLYLNIKLDPLQWECTMIKSSMCGLPLSLKNCAIALGLDEQKMDEGKILIKEFCQPNKRSKNLLFDDDKWNLFKKYCKQDVNTERAIRKSLSWYSMPEKEKRLYALDYWINKRGILIDKALVSGAINMDERHTEKLTEEARKINNYDKPISPLNLTKYLISKGIEVKSINKTSIGDLQNQGIKDKEVLRLLELRQELSKTSTAKYITMDKRACEDDRVRGSFQFYASRTGRWAGRGVQLQNLPQNHLDDLENARKIIKKEDEDLLSICYKESLPDILSQLIRTAFIAPEGYTFAVADFSAIEARVIAWLSGEKWRQDVFATTGKIYEASASNMFGLPMEECGKGTIYRQKGKIAELALGYQGGMNALKIFGADKMGLCDEELKNIVVKWREKSPHIVELWSKVEKAVTHAIDLRGSYIVNGKIEISKQDKYLCVKLPSKRELHYYNPQLKINALKKPTITYYGNDQITNKWKEIDTYGGKLVENIVQAIARDCLGETMLRLKDKGYERIVMHVHDEVIVEVKKERSEKALQDIEDIMKTPIQWAEDLLLKGDGYTTDYYKKD